MNETAFAANTRLSSDDVVSSIETNLPTVDAARTQSYSQLALLRDAKARSLTKEQTLLTIKNGAGSPRIAQAAAAFTVNESVRREVAVTREVVETPAPAVDASSFVVCGFVRQSSTQAGIPGLTLALTDDQGNWIKSFGYACTDARGYFELTIKIAQLSRDVMKTVVTSVEANDPTAAGGTSSTAFYILRVFDNRGHTLHSETNPVVIKADSLDYRLILLDGAANAVTCKPPPAQTGGKPVAPGPIAGRSPTTAETPLRPTPAAAPQAYVGGLKSYQPPAGAGQPLEAIRGIGPKTAEKLREAGIPDVAAFEKTPGQKLVDLAGFDKTSPKAAETAPEKSPAPAAAKPAAKPATTGKTKRKKR